MTSTFPFNDSIQQHTVYSTFLSSHAGKLILWQWSPSFPQYTCSWLVSLSTSSFTAATAAFPEWALSSTSQLSPLCSVLPVCRHPPPLTRCMLGECPSSSAESPPQLSWLGLCPPDLVPSHMDTFSHRWALTSHARLLIAHSLTQHRHMLVLQCPTRMLLHVDAVITCLGSETLRGATHRRGCPPHQSGWFSVSAHPVWKPSSACLARTRHAKLPFRVDDYFAWLYLVASGLNCSICWRERVSVVWKPDAEMELGMQKTMFEETRKVMGHNKDCSQPIWQGQPDDAIYKNLRQVHIEESAEPVKCKECPSDEYSWPWTIRHWTSWAHLYMHLFRTGTLERSWRFVTIWGKSQKTVVA